MTEEETSRGDWKEIGNVAFKAEKYEDAIQAYSSGLEANPNSVPLLSNRAAAYLHLDTYNKALQDAEAALKLDPSHAKALYRKVKALQGLERFSDAIEFVKKHVNELNSSSADLGKTILAQTEKFQKQAKTGVYDMAEIIEDQLKNVECAEYRVDGLKVQEIPGKGRGLVATTQFQPGQLLIVSKPIGFATFKTSRPAKEVPVDPKSLPVVEPEIIADLESARLELVEVIAQRLRISPEKCREVYGLYAGPSLGYLDEPGNTDEVAIDKQRLEKIVKYNSIWGEGKVTYGWKESVGGLWLGPSLINHACLGGNAKWELYGKMLFVTSVRKVEVGEEITFSYYSPDESDANRQQVLLTHKFSCKCDLCEIEASETEEIKSKRTELLVAYDKLSYAPGAIFSTETAELAQLVADLEALRPNELKLSPYLFQPLKLLAKRHFKREEYKQALEVLEKLHSGLESTTLLKLRVTFSANILAAHLKQEKTSVAENWARVLKEDVRVAYGEPVAKILPLIAPDIAQKINQNNIDF